MTGPAATGPAATGPAGTRELWLLKGTLAGLSSLPLPWARTLGRLIGRGLARGQSRAATVTRRNLVLAFPHWSEAQREALTRSSLAQTAVLAAEMGSLWWANPRRVLARAASVTGRDALDTPRGCLILGCHMGNWEWLNLWLASQDAGTRPPFLALFDPQGPPEVQAWVRQRRQRTGARLFPLNPGGLRAALLTLRNKGRVGLLVDQVPGHASGVYAPFFGHPALTMTLVRSLLRRSDATAVFATAIRQAQGFDVTFRRTSGLDAQDPLAAATALNEGVERCIGSSLDQYLWCYKRYKRQPEGMPDPYE